MTTTRSAREPMPTSPRRPSALGLRARVRDEERAGDGRHRDGDEDRVVLRREDVGDRRQHEALAHAVGGRVEERAERRRLAAGACERAVQDVEQRADDEDEPRRASRRGSRSGPSKSTRTEAAAQSGDAARREGVRRDPRAGEADHRARRERARAGRVAVLDRGRSAHGRDRSSVLAGLSLRVGVLSSTDLSSGSTRTTRRTGPGATLKRISSTTLHVHVETPTWVPHRPRRAYEDGEFIDEWELDDNGAV